MWCGSCVHYFHACSPQKAHRDGDEGGRPHCQPYGHPPRKGSHLQVRGKSVPDAGRTTPSHFERERILEFSIWIDATSVCFELLFVWSVANEIVGASIPRLSAVPASPSTYYQSFYLPSELPLLLHEVDPIVVVVLEADST